MNAILQRASRWLKTNGWRDLGLPFTVYTLVALAITWPLVTQLSTHVAGPEYGDSVEYMRLGWWGKYALQHGLNPFYQSLLGYPQGFFSATQWAQPLIYWPISLLGFVFSPAAAFNVWLLLETILNGVTAYWLCRDVLRRSPLATLAGLFGGLIFMAYPAMQGHIIAGHVNPLANYGFPVLALCTYRIIEGRGGLRTALAGSVAILILAMGNFTFPAFLLLPFVLFGGGYLLVFRRNVLLQRITLRNLLIMLVGGVILMIPFYVPLAADIFAPTKPAYLDANGWVFYSADLLSFVTPSPFNAILAPVVPAYSTTILGNNALEGSAYIGLIALVLALVAIWKRRELASMWLVIALGCMLFSLGPVLKVNGERAQYTLGTDVRSEIVLPWAVFQKLPFISSTRTPGRFNMATGLAVGVLAAIGLEIVLQRLVKRRWQIAAAVVLAALMLVEYQVMLPFPTTPVQVPPYFTELSTRPDMRAVLSVPWDNALAQKNALNEQVVHQHPLIAGYVSRVTPIDAAKFALLSDVAMGRSYSPTLAPLDKNAARTILQDFGVDVVVYHWWHVDKVDKEIVQRSATANFLLPAYTDKNLTIHEIIPPEKQVDATALVFSKDGWWRRTPADTIWLTGDGSIYLYAPTAQDRQWTLQLAPLLQDRRLQLAVDNHIVHAWDVKLPVQEVTFWLQLTRGIHTLRLIAPDGCTPVPVLPMCMLNGTNLDSPECRLRDSEIRKASAISETGQNGPDSRDSQDSQNGQNTGSSGNSGSQLCVSMALKGLQANEVQDMQIQPRDVHLSGGGTEWTLQGIRLPTQTSPGTTIDIETNWQVSHKPSGDYHLFTHILDQNGKLVAQYDTIPGAGTYPTAMWADQQQWIETAHIALPADLPAGKYSAYTGWYGYPDLTRLKVDETTPHAADGLVYLGNVEVK